MIWRSLWGSDSQIMSWDLEHWDELWVDKIQDESNSMDDLMFSFGLRNVDDELELYTLGRGMREWRDNLLEVIWIQIIWFRVTLWPPIIRQLQEPWLILVAHHASTQPLDYNPSIYKAPPSLHDHSGPGRAVVKAIQAVSGVIKACTRAGAPTTTLVEAHSRIQRLQ